MLNDVYRPGEIKKDAVRNPGTVTSDWNPGTALPYRTVHGILLGPTDIGGVRDTCLGACSQ